MEMNEYQRQALVTMMKFDSKKDQIINGLLGLAGESGEVCELLKKHFCVGDELDKEKLKKELGDVMWYIAEICDAYGFTMQDVAEKNISKLRARHGEKFSGTGDRTGEGE
jgi:NTP pyrophosphatase (non-canonical NTP hydrolase)